MSRTYVDDTDHDAGWQSPARGEEIAHKLGESLRAEFERAERARRQVENDWLKSARQYAGQYEPDVLARIPKNGQGQYTKSTVYVRHTKAKCDTLRAKLMELLFPASGDVNWGIAPSPKPEIPQVALIQAEEEAQAKGEELPKDTDKLTNEVARRRAEEMSDLIRDQLNAAPVSYRKCCMSVLRSGIIYGSGILKGPLVTAKSKSHYIKDAASGEWVMTTIGDEFMPYFEFVPIWSVYPDPAANRPEQLSYIWQTHIKTRKDLIDLCRMPGFRGDLIRAYLAGQPDGDMQLKEHETELRTIMRAENFLSNEDLKGRYRLLERWGYLTGKQLLAAGMTEEELEGHFPGFDPEAVYAGNIWLTESGMVIKCSLSPVEDMAIPYYFFQPYADDAGFWAEGLPDVIRDMQVVINAAARMTLDNAAIACGPQLAVNMRALAQEEDPTSMHGGKVWLFDTADDMNSCFKEIGVSSHISELLTIGEKYAVFSDETSFPRYMGGNNQGVRGAGDTASGLSMLMTAASLPVKDMVAAFDTGITEPFIRAMYRWNMRYSGNDDVKGDYEVKATGSTSLIAQELMGRRLMEAMQVLTVPGMAEQTNFERLYKHILRASELPEDIQMSKDEIESRQQEQARMQAAAQLEAVLMEAGKQGIPLPQQLASVAQGVLQQLGVAMPGQQAGGDSAPQM